MSSRADRRPRPAWTVREGDVIHDTAAPMRVLGWCGLQLCGVTRSRVPVRVTHPLGRVLDVTRLADPDDPDDKDATMRHLAFIAMTTTGPSADSHEIWELSVRLRRASPGARDAVHHWQLPVQELHRGEGARLRSSGFYSRYREFGEPAALDPQLNSYRPVAVADLTRNLAAFLVDAHPVMLHPEYDQPFLGALLRRNGQPAGWKSAVPLTAFAAGAAYGYAAGWNRHVGLQPGLLGEENLSRPNMLNSAIDTSEYGLPWCAVELAREMSLAPAAYADVVSAAGRLALTVALWDAIVAPPVSQVSSAGVAPAAADASTVFMPVAAAS
ncbi:hypothetical protein [Streptosporangium sp. NPDC050280]|uniref:hypothetical protein n=1 Tax=unclassified Streptosporangium TaxID=2632669 RepID=UPI00342AB527